MAMLFPWNDSMIPTWETWWEINQFKRGSDDDCYYDPTTEDGAEVDGFGILY